MRTYLSICFITLSIFTSFAQKGAIKTGFSAILSEASFGIGGGVMLEYATGHKFSMATSIDYTTSKSTEFASNGRVSFSQTVSSPVISFRPEFRFYPQEAMKGFFVGLAGGLGVYRYNDFFINSSLQPQLNTGNEAFFYPALMLGANLQPSPKLCIEISGGLGVTTNEDGGGIIPINLRFGYTF